MIRLVTKPETKQKVLVMLSSAFPYITKACHQRILYLVDVTSGKVTGTVGYEVVPSEQGVVMIRHLFVKSGFRLMGVASGLLAGVFARFPATTIYEANVRRDNLKSRLFFLKHGFISPISFNQSIFKFRKEPPCAAC